ncbi:hypothetical protein GBAR_LOCUS25523 [Geodia barretti]|uniref:Uncharacterized protein n=1 Tax=Geodia barretti TaxID=519541 RepID=A0AA35TD91_GEOBA|nr:hypothetical protein GBAR_LOCUS25523 [Geodia barretti]
MATFTLLPTLVVLLSNLRPLAANWAALNATGEIPVYIGQHVILKCSGPTRNPVQLLEVGRQMTFEELAYYDDLPPYVNSLHYVPEGCNLPSSPESTPNCSKLVNLTVTPDVDGKSYKCRSLDRQNNTDDYSAEGTVKVSGDCPVRCHYQLTIALLLSFFLFH